MYRVLLICKDNSVLSPIAEGYFRLFADASTEVYCAGVEPDRISPLVVELMKEDGVDISDITQQAISHYKHIDFDYILTFDALSEAESHHLPSKMVKYHFDFDRLLPNLDAGDNEKESYANIREKIKRIVKSFIKDHNLAKAE